MEARWKAEKLDGRQYAKLSLFKEIKTLNDTIYGPGAVDGFSQ